MRLRRKPWVDEAIRSFDAFVFSKDRAPGEERKGKWRELFGREAPLHVELGTGKGDFISQLAERLPAVDFIGIETDKFAIFVSFGEGDGAEDNQFVVDEEIGNGLIFKQSFIVRPNVEKLAANFNFDAGDQVAVEDFVQIMENIVG